MTPACRHCGCSEAGGAATHALLDALSVDDLDRALERGLMTAMPCPGCAPACGAALIAARSARERAFAARERYRKRQARLQRLAREREARRTSTSPATAPDRERPPLPSAAAAALARAKARAAERDR